MDEPARKKSRLHWWILLGMVSGAALGSAVYFVERPSAERAVLRDALLERQAVDDLRAARGLPQNAEFVPDADELAAKIAEIDAAERAAVLERARGLLGPNATEDELAAQADDLRADALDAVAPALRDEILGAESGAFDAQLRASVETTAPYRAFHGLARIFLNLLKMIVIPLVFFSLTSGILGMGDTGRLGRIGIKTFLLYTFTSFVAILTGLAVVNVIQPGAGLAVPLPPEATKGAHEVPDSFWDVLVNMVPPNVFASASNFDLLGVIVFTIFFGAVLLSIGPEQRAPLTSVVEVGAEVMTRMTKAILALAPVGIGALIARLISTTGPGVFLEMIWYIVTVLTALGIHVFVTLPLLILLVTRRNPYRYLRTMSPAILTAFSTASSSGTLGVTMERAEKGAGISNRVASFVLPLGATINMDGTALYEIVSVLFIAQIHEGVDPGFVLTFQQQLLIVFLGLTVSVGAAGIPHAGLVMMVIILNAVGLPVEYTAVIWSVDRVLDMCRTATNVASDSSIALVIAHTEDEVADPPSAA